MNPDKDDLGLSGYLAGKTLDAHSPLAARMRPRTLEEFVGQEHILGPGRLLRRAIEADKVSSIIFYGPPGTGKTTLARVIAGSTHSQFLALNAVLSGVKDIRESIETAKAALGNEARRTLLFIDEVHRFNKSQQDALLPHVENGTIILIGATTENPYFEVNKALVSRSRIFELFSLEEMHLEKIIHQAIADADRGLGKLNISLSPEALNHWVVTASGDARSALGALELAAETTEPDKQGVIHINEAVAEESIQKKAVYYDKDGDAHYDVISAFIKSIRGSDPDAALYWMAKMVYAGEDPRYIFRRMLVLASEDVGLADSNAVSIVQSLAQTFDYVGMPEGRYHLAHACLYLATAPKSNSTLAFFDALKAIKEEKQGEIPNPLKDGNRDGEDLGHGKDYLYPHSYRDHWVAQQYLPGTLKGRIFYQPSAQGAENTIKDRVLKHRELTLAHFLDSGSSMAIQSWEDRTFYRDEFTEKALEFFSSSIPWNRSDLILIAGGDNGLLLWESLRNIKTGGVVALLREPSSSAVIKHHLDNMDFTLEPELINYQSGIKISLPEGYKPDKILYFLPTGFPAATREAEIEEKILTDLMACLPENSSLYLFTLLPEESSGKADFFMQYARKDLKEKITAAFPLPVTGPDEISRLAEIAGNICTLEQKAAFNRKLFIKKKTAESWLSGTKSITENEKKDLLQLSADGLDKWHTWKTTAGILKIISPAKKV